MTTKTAKPARATLGALMDRSGGRATGFDYLRLFLALGVMVIHSVDVSYGTAYAYVHGQGWVRPFMVGVVPMFFALSGFLIAGSLARSATLVSFAGLRFLRIVPALAVVTFITAFVLGPILTQGSLSAYFSDPLFFAYFANAIGHTQYMLPGMFETNPWAHTVNAQLWTLPYELMCYAALMVLCLLGLHKRRAMFAGLVVAANLFFATRHFVAGDWGVTTAVAGDALIFYFLYGVVFYQYRDRIAFMHWLGAASGVLSFALLIGPMTEYWAPIAVTYFCIYLGLMRPKLAGFMRKGDYSYGIFLIGFPIQQIAAQLIGPAGWEWYWSLAVALPITWVLAAASWHFIEKPVLGLRGPLVGLEARWMSVKARIFGAAGAAV